jgi:hypothetical protein
MVLSQLPGLAGMGLAELVRGVAWRTSPEVPSSVGLRFLNNLPPFGLNQLEWILLSAG